MLGPTDTKRGPELAPEGTVMVIEVSLQELIVTGLPFNVTTLLPAVAPKLKPVITTWLPMEAVVAERFVMCGAGEFAELTDTLSNATVSRAVVD